MTRDELLVLLIEEAGEVIQAATKCLRFGFTREWPDYGVNHEVLAKEVGEFIAVAEALGLSFSIINLAKAKKLDRAEFWKKYFLEHPIK